MKENEILGGFSALFDEMMPNAPQERVIKGMEVIEDPNDPDNNVRGMNDDRHIEEEEEEEMLGEEQELEVEEESTEEPEKEEESTEFVDEGEATQVEALFDAIAEQVGWSDIADEEKPKSIESLIEYMKESIEASSAPVYANDDVAALDKYIKAGGNIEDFLSVYSQDSDYDNIDLDDEANQKAVLSRFLQEKGYSDTQIRRKIEKYEDAGLLKDEAEDSLEFLKEIDSERKEALLVEQENLAKTQLEAQQKFYTDVVSEIEALTDVRGIKIPSKDKRELQDYIFKVEQDGKTKYQKDYASSTKNLIESAYFTMKGDSLVESAKRSGETSAVDRLRMSLNSTKISGSKQKINTGAPAPLWSIASQQLLGGRK